MPAKDIFYRYALAEEEPERHLYLAVPLQTYKTFFSQQFIEFVIENSQINLIVYDADREVIAKWKK